MKHITSKLLSLLLCLAMLMSMIPAAYATDDGESTGGENSTEDTTVEPAKAVEANSSEGATALTSYVTVNGDTTQYATLDGAIAAAEPVNGVITYTISGKIEVASTGTAWIRVLKDGLTGVTEVKFVGADENAEISLTNPTSVLADQTYDINVSFENLTLSHPNGEWVGDLGHATNYFACVLRNPGASENTVTYTKCVFPNGVCNNQYGNTVFDNCQFTNATSGKYNLWNYGGNTVVKNSSFTGVRGIKTYKEEGTSQDTSTVTPTVTVENTTFTGLTEKAAIVASKPTNITLTDISATDCANGFFQKDIGGSSNDVTIAANGSNISGTFNVTADMTPEAAKNELNITSGKLKAVAGNSLNDLKNYLADNLTISEDGTVTESPSTTYVAEVGGTSYDTLAEAIAAAKDGDTVTLLADCNGNGIQIKTETFATKGLTVDFGGHSYTVGGMLVGSPGTGTNAFQLFEGGKVTFKNGKIIGVAAGTKPAEDTPNWHGAPAIMLQNYCDLTLYEMEVMGGDQTVYTMSNNHGNVVIENSIIKAGGAKGYPYGPYAFDVCGYSSYTGVSVTVRGTSVINGDIEVSRSANNTNDVKLALESGTINGTLKIDSSIKSGDATTITKFSDVILAAPEGYEWSTNGTLTEANYVAEVNGVKYDTLQAAIDKAPRNATVTLLADTTENVTISTPYVTLDLNGHTLNGGIEKGKPALTITARVTVKDSSEEQTGTIMREDTAENSGVSSHYVIDVQGSGWLTFESGNVKNNSGNNAGKGASLVRVGDDSVDKYPGLNIKGGTFTQNNFIVIKVDSGDLFLNGGTLNCEKSYAVEDWHRATIKGGTVNGTVAAWTYSGGHKSTLEISGGTVNGNVAAISYDGSAGKQASVSITGGTVNGTLGTYTYSNGLVPTEETAKATIKVTGGTFSSNPTKYVVEDSSVTPNSDGTFGVAKAYLAQVGKNSYYTMDEAFKAQTASGEPIVLLRDYTTGSTFNSGTVARVVNLNGYTWTCTGTDANSAAFEINNPNASLTVKNGKIVSSQLVGLIPSASHGTITYDNSSLVFDGVEMTTTATSGIETNGNNTNDNVTLKNSTLSVPNGFGIYFPSSGTLTIDNSTINAKTMGVQVCAGSLNITGDKTAIDVSGDPVVKIEGDGAIQDGAAISIVNRIGYKGLGDITVTGGTFTAKSGNAAIKAYKWESQTESAFDANDKVSVSGGTFSSAVPEDLCAEGYEPIKNPDGTYGVKASTPVAVVNGVQYYSLEKAIAAAKDSDTVTLLADATEDVTINKNITLDLGGKTLTNTSTGKATISVTGGTVTVKNGNVIGGTSYYNIEVTKDSNANLTLEGVTATAGNTGSSMIDNWGTLTITSGTYTGGLDTVKSEEDSKLTITGGKFVSDYAPKYNVTGTILVYGETAITGGEFVQNSTSTAARVVVTGVVEGHTPSLTKVSGGKFTTKSSGAIFHWMGKATPDNFEVSGGSYSKSVSELVCADGFIPTKNADGTYGVKEGKYVAAVGKTKYETLADAIRLAAKGKTVKLLDDVTENIEIAKAKNFTLNLNGHTINGGTVKDKATITNYGTVTITDKSTAKTGTIKRDDQGVEGETSYYVIRNIGTMTIEQANVVNNSGYRKTNPSGSMVGSSLICNGGDVGATLTINGGTFTQMNFLVVKNDALGTLNVTGGTFTSKHSAIQNWFKANITGGEINGQLWTDSWAVGESVGETTIGGNATVKGEIVMDITGSVKPTLEISGGNFDVTWRITNAAAKAGAKPAVSGGTFSSAVKPEYCAIGFVPKANSDGTYGVKAAEGNAAMFDAEGKLIGYKDVAAALANSDAKTVKLIKDVTDSAVNVILHSGVILDLNGHALTAEFVYAPLGGDAGIIDSAVKGGGTGKLLLKDMKTSMGYTDGYMPIYAGQEDGLHCYKFYTVKYYPVKNVNRGTDAVEIRFWFIFESKQAYKDILDHPDQFRVQLDTDLGNAEEGGARQTLYFEFRQDMITSWAQQNYNGFDSHNGAKFLVVLRGLDEAKATTIKGTPFAESKYTMAKYYGNDITIK